MPRAKKTGSATPADVPLRRSRRIMEKLRCLQSNPPPATSSDDELPDENFASSSASTTRKRRGQACDKAAPKAKKATKPKAEPSNTSGASGDGDDSDIEMLEVKDESTDTSSEMSCDPGPSSSTTKKSKKSKKVKRETSEEGSDRSISSSDFVSDKRKVVKKSKASARTRGSRDINSARNTGHSQKVTLQAEQYIHETFEFLKPSQVKDADGHSPGDDYYNSKTLYIPDEFMENQTPSMRQYWQIKSRNFDCVVCFRVGKFYELYHSDAVIGFEALNLTPIKAPYAHCGFPEVSFGKYSGMLINRGYNVARIEQTERGDARDRRCDANKGEDKVVLREVCQIVSAATRTHTAYDGDNNIDSALTHEPHPQYLMMIFEEKVEKKKDGDKYDTRYGVVLLDASTAEFRVSQFGDDECRSVLRTVCAHFQPCHILYPRFGTEAATLSVLNSTMSAAKKESLLPMECKSVDYVIQKLSGDKFYSADLGKWPLHLECLFDPDPDTPAFELLPENKIIFKALGGMISCLERCIIDVDMFLMKKFETYTPPCLRKLSDEKRYQSSMVLDGATLINLHLVPPFAGAKAIPTLRDSTSATHSLYAMLDYCKTPMGKRLLRSWICSPSCNADTIDQRRRAVQILLTEPILELIQKALTKMPDLERLVQKIHSNGLRYRATEHPDSRATFFFAETFTKRKIRDFIAALDGFKRITELATEVNDKYKIVLSALLRECFETKFPDVQEDLDHFAQAFDHEAALRTGVVAPREGVVEEYDAAAEVVKDREAEIQAYVEREQEQWSCDKIRVGGAGKWKYLFIEFPEDVADKLPSDGYRFKTKVKNVKRYMTQELEALVSRFCDAEQVRDREGADFGRLVFADFSDRKDKWDLIIENVAIIDVLASFATYCLSCRENNFPCNAADVSFGANETFIKMTNGYHPLLISGGAKLAKNTLKVVPNDLLMGRDPSDSDSEPVSGASSLERVSSAISSENVLIAPTAKVVPKVVCLTGPNMGGKSTLMRQVAMMVVMAQMGCPVPADDFRISVVDRIFSRIGAHDCSFAGQSTFYVELSETSTILRHATPNSFVVIDELGRGTSTNDGTAIAAAVLREIANKINCRAFFSTHYFAVCDMVAENPNVRQAHMKFYVENEDEDDPTNEDVTYLYKLVDGICTKSYGFYAAKLAGMPLDLIRGAHASHNLLEEQQSRFREGMKKRLAVQRKVHKLQRLRRLCNSADPDPNDLAQLILMLL
uniref:DNA mismatch repair protein n=1 Tax=Panagrellus redivivus TaxID=6233 RepID=A0A7E4VVG1_PANRE